MNHDTSDTRRPRIGIDARLNAYRQGGIAEYTRRLVAALARLDADHDYLALEHARQSPGESIVPPDAPHVRRVRVFTPPHHRWERLALAAEIAPRRLDILHSPDFVPPLFGARRYVITVHDLTFLFYPEFQTADSLRYYRGHIRDAVRQAAHILADSAATRDDLIARLGVPDTKITVNMLGVDERFRPMPPDDVAAVRARLKLPERYFLFVGTFEPRKNLAGLLEAFARVRVSLPGAPDLVLAGRRGWLFDDIFHKADGLQLGKSLHWVENVPDTDLPALYNGAVALVLPSFYEGFGFPPLEAMACGIPTIVSNRASLPEVVGDTGLLIDPDRIDELAGALFRAATDADFRRRSGEAGLARARQFTWENTARTVLDVYRRVLASS
ncbi:MAG: glycosyltransferase family 4 protein [Anaerolineae bacterium]|nr:glycosyltransferase family 4 protein [Anaerolineae bacterium]